MVSYADTYEANGVPTNGASVSLYAASRFVGEPAQGSSPPAGGPSYGPVATDPAHGGSGAFRFDGVAPGAYYAVALYGGTYSYKYVTIGGGGSGGGGGTGGGTGEFRVSQFGAVGSGDETVKIQAAWLAASTAGAKLVYEPGVHYTHGPVQAYASLDVVATGATITLPNNSSHGSGCWLWGGGSHFSLTGGTWDGNEANQGVQALNWLGVFSGPTQPVVIAGATVQHLRGAAIIASSANDLVVQECTFDEMGNSALQNFVASAPTARPRNTTVRNCRFRNITHIGRPDATAPASINLGRVDGVSITGNVFQGCLSAAVVEYCTAVDVGGNRLYGCGDGIRVSQADTDIVGESYDYWANVHHNIIMGCTSTSSPAIGVRGNYVQVEHNIIRGNGAGADGYMGIDVSAGLSDTTHNPFPCRHVRVRFNTVSNCKYDGILIANNLATNDMVDDITIEDNDLRGNGRHSISFAPSTGRIRRVRMARNLMYENGNVPLYFYGEGAGFVDVFCAVRTRDLGCMGDARTHADGVVSPDGLTLTSAAGDWSAVDVGKSLVAAKDGTDFSTVTIATVASATQVTLSTALPAGLHSATGVTYWYGTNDGPQLRIASALSDVAGKDLEIEPGRYLLATSGSIPDMGGNGFGCWIYSGQTIWGHGEASELICGAEGGNVLFTWQTNGWTVRDLLINCFAGYVGGMKPVDSSDALISNVGTLDGRMGLDLLTMKRTRVENCWARAGNNLTRISLDTRGLSVADNGIATGVTDGVLVMNFHAQGYHNPVRVVMNTQRNPHVILQNIQADGVLYADTDILLSIEYADGVIVDGFRGTIGNYGIQILSSDDVRLTNWHVNNIYYIGCILWASRNCHLEGHVQDCDVSALFNPAFRLGEYIGVGSTGNTFDCRSSGSAQYSLQELAGTGSLTGFNEFRGVYAQPVSTLMPTSRADVLAVGARIIKKSSTAAATAIADNATVTLTDADVVRLNPAAARTGIILAAGTLDKQRGTIANEAAAANTVTMAAAGTSHVFGGAGVVIAGGTTRQFEWWASDSLWHPL